MVAVELVRPVAAVRDSVADFLLLQTDLIADVAANFKQYDILIDIYLRLLEAERIIQGSPQTHIPPKLSECK